MMISFLRLFFLLSLAQIVKSIPTDLNLNLQDTSQAVDHLSDQAPDSSNGALDFDRSSWRPESATPSVVSVPADLVSGEIEPSDSHIFSFTGDSYIANSDTANSNPPDASSPGVSDGSGTKLLADDVEQCQSTSEETKELKMNFFDIMYPGGLCGHRNILNQDTTTSSGSKSPTKGSNASGSGRGGSDSSAGRDRRPAPRNGIVVSKDGKPICPPGWTAACCVSDPVRTIELANGRYQFDFAVCTRCMLCLFLSLCSSLSRSESTGFCVMLTRGMH